MINERLLCEMFHSIAVYSMAAGAPHLLKLPDLIQSLVDGNKEQANDDAGVLAVECILLLVEPYLAMTAGEGDYDKWKSEITERVPIIRNMKNKIDAKNMALDLVNEVVAVLGEKEIERLQ